MREQSKNASDYLPTNTGVHLRTSKCRVALVWERRSASLVVSSISLTRSFCHISAMTVAVLATARMSTFHILIYYPWSFSPLSLRATVPVWHWLEK